MTLPGGFQLPVALVTDTYFLSESEEAKREDTEALLSRELRGHVKRLMTAGTIQREAHRFDGGKLTAVYECQEMIGVFRPGIYTEGDWNDRQNRERGAG